MKTADFVRNSSLAIKATRLPFAADLMTIWYGGIVAREETQGMTRSHVIRSSIYAKKD